MEKCVSSNAKEDSVQLKAAHSSVKDALSSICTRQLQEIQKLADTQTETVKVKTATMSRLLDRLVEEMRQADNVSNDKANLSAENSTKEELIAAENAKKTELIAARHAQEAIEVEHKKLSDILIAKNAEVGGLQDTITTRRRKRSLLRRNSVLPQNTVLGSFHSSYTGGAVPACWQTPCR